MNTYSIILFALISVFISNGVRAQITIDGTVTDADLNPVSGALVEIIDENDSTNVYSSNTNEQGYFSISAITGIEANPTKVPKDCIVLSNYPNPFNPTTVIYFELPEADNIEIVIYDILGREVRALYKAFHEAGRDQIIWDGRNNRSSPVAAGIYLCRLKTKEQSKVHKMVLLDGGSGSFSISNKRMLKSHLQKTSSINNIFNFRLRVTGNNILETEFRYLTCSKDTTVNLKVPSILQSATIGPGGGKLETEGFSLTIPKGAFSGDFNLKLAIGTDSVSFEEEKFSKLFRIDGLPVLYNEDLKLKIKLNKQPLDSISLAISRIDTLNLSGVEIYNYDYISASDSNGYALVTIPSSYNANSLMKKELTIQNTIDLRKYLIVLASRGIVESSNGNFIIHYPKSKTQFIPDIDYYLEDAVDIIKSYGFKKLPLSSPETYTNWPVKVTFQTTSQTFKKYKLFVTIPSFYYPKRLSHKKFEIVINSDSISYSSLSNLRRHLGGNVFLNFIWQDNLGHSYYPDTLWLNLSLAIWSIKLFSKDETYIPYEWNFKPSLYTKEILQGLNISRDDLELAGTALIEYFSKISEKKDKIIFEIYNSVMAKKSSVEGIISLFEDTENIWWPDFFKEFINGNIYNIQGENFLNNITKTIEFNDGDTLKYIDETYNDLSAKLFRVNISSKEIKDNKSLNFKLGPSSLNLDYVKTLVFGISGNNLTFLSEGIDFSVGSLYQYDGLLACVVNSGNEPPYTGTSNINLDIRVKEELPFNRCTINVRVNGVFEYHRIPPPPDTEPSIDTVDWGANWETKGNFTGYIYEGIINTESEGEGQKTIKLILDENLNIISFDLKGKDDDGTNYSEWSCSGSNISPINQTTDYIEYEIFNQNTCIGLTNVYFYSEIPTSTPGVRRYSKMTNYFCDENSYLKIVLSKWVW